MNMIKKNIIFCWLLFAGYMLSAQHTVEWRYDRTGVYSNETGLLKSWPAKGPELLWHYDGLGDGHSSVTAASEKLYVTGLIEEKGYLFVFDKTGKLLNKIMYGDEWKDSYPGPRASPVINSGKIYLMSVLGNLICLDEKNLNVIWERNILAEFDAKSESGLNESPLIIGDMIIATPGGKEHNVIALNKNTGKLIWTSTAMGEIAAYCSPLYIGDQKIPLIVTQTHEHIIGLEASTGKLMWSVEHKNKNAIHPNTPLYENGMILCTSVDPGSKMLRLLDGGRKVEIAWENPLLDNMMGGMVKLGNYCYFSAGNPKNKFWYCVNWETGEIMYKEDGLVNSGVTISADNMLYCYSEKGDMALVRPNPEKFDMVSKFKITLGTDQHWAHPSIYQGVLYVRHGDALMAYKIKD